MDNDAKDCGSKTQRVQVLPVKQGIALLQTSHQMARLCEETKNENKCPGQSFQDLLRTLTVLSESLKRREVRRRRRELGGIS